MSVFNLFYFPGASVIFGCIKKKKKKRMCCSTLRHVIDIKNIIFLQRILWNLPTMNHTKVSSVINIYPHDNVL